MAEQQTIVEETIADNSSETDKPVCKLDLDTKPNMTNNYPPFSLEEEAASFS